MTEEHPDGWSEDRLHRWLAEQPWPASLAGSRGHDAAVLESFRGRPVLCTDQCIEGVHFELGAGGRAAGRKAVLRTLSDLAATASVPFAVTLGLMAPERIQGVALESWLRAAITGANDAATEHGAELVAGDLAMAQGPIALSVTALGRVPASGDPVGRDRAQPGQVVVLSGPVGGSFPSDRHLEPVPRIEAGLAIAAAGATAMMDVSDGLAWDLYRLARASDASVRLATEAIRLHADAVEAARSSGRSALDHGLHDGEDHELIATISPEDWEAEGESLRALGWYAIGSVREKAIDDSLLELSGPDGVSAWSPGSGRGWQHGA